MTSRRAHGAGRGPSVRGHALRFAIAVALLAGARSATAQGTLSQLQTDVDQIARRARPSVVTVFAQSVPRAPGDSRPARPGQRGPTRAGSARAGDRNRA